ncbi:hypothetical protein MMA231_03594 (plasmid) [Asticcacaulis sp. MM231]|uniref:sensor domain-containing phosphodiesterase n=1 Tax=Asticcacaulis sp. MM231 TaxID=3157666 RepID=UPI0032D577A6
MNACGLSEAGFPARPGASQQPLMSALAKGSIENLLNAVRIHLGMDVGFISEFSGDQRYFRYVDAKPGQAPVKVGDVMSLNDGYCKKVVDGDLPELIVDTAKVLAALSIPATHALPIGSHVSVPLLLSDGRLFGTFCCFSHLADTTLNARDLDVMRTFAAIVAHQIETELYLNEGHQEARRRVEAVLASSLPDIVYQPIYDLENLHILGAEALSRFSSEPVRAPDLWFADAEAVGLKAELELKAITKALRGYKDVWKQGDIYLGVNCSPQTIVDADWQSLLKGVPARRLVLEITEHDHVEDYDRLNLALKPLRARGVKISVDDAGSGYASMRHILNLNPDVIKLDISLTRGIDADRTRQALARALISFADQIGSKVVAEGIETAAELCKLTELGTHAAQGYYLGRPLRGESFCELASKTNEGVAAVNDELSLSSSVWRSSRHSARSKKSV